MEDAPPDHYSVLGTTQSATPDDIRQAFRARALVAHPDKGGDPGEFERLRRAYDVLVDDEARAAYDEEYAQRASLGVAWQATATLVVPVSCLFRDSRHTVRYDRRDGDALRAMVTDVMVPAGTHDYTRLAVDGMGHDGDELVVLVRHKPMRGVTVSGSTVDVDATVTLRQALFPCEGVSVRRPDGKLLSVRFPRDRVLAPGTRWRVPEAGLPRTGTTAGDLILNMRVVFPQQIDHKLKRTIAPMLGHHTPPTHEGVAVAAVAAGMGGGNGADGGNQRTRWAPLIPFEAADDIACLVQ